MSACPVTRLDARHPKAATSTAPWPAADGCKTAQRTATISPEPRHQLDTTASLMIGAIPVNTVQILTLLLALSGALNVAFVAGIAARHAGASPAQAILTAGAAAGTVMATFFTAVSAYR